MQKQLATLMKREMTRKEFMLTLGFGAATLLGMGSILQLVKPNFAQNLGSGHTKAAANGYGSRAYGN